MNKIKAQHMSQNGTAVDYVGLRQGDLWGELQERLEVLRLLEPNRWPHHQQRTFWINLYNVLTLQAVVEHGHPGSNPLKQLPFFTRKNWVIGPHRFSLDDIEHGILRGNRRNPFFPFKPFEAADPRLGWSLPLEPRIHFALNCGAKSCPPIGVYTAELLEEQLELATHSFLQSEVEIDGNVLRLSALLKWYQADFGGRDGVVQLLGRVLGFEGLELARLKWVYKPYSWTINALK